MQISDKLVIGQLPRTIWKVFSSFFILYCYWTRLKARETSLQYIRNLRKYWTYIAIETMRELMHTANNWKNKSESQTLNNIPFDILLSGTFREEYSNDV